MKPRPAHAGPRAAADEAVVATLGNGVRVVVFRLPQLATAAVSVFVRSGSQHEGARQNGISHFIEHMAFKGTRTRDCQQVNLDAERLGAEVNAHTDKDHTAFHMRGLARDALAFLRMLGDVVRHGTFPEAELERERQVILNDHSASAGAWMMASNCSGLSRSLPRGLARMDDRSRIGTGFRIVEYAQAMIDFILTTPWFGKIVCVHASYPIRRSGQTS